jgi:uncharacterized protein (DUF433 family)
MENSLIISDPEIMSGTPCFAGTRVPVKNLYDYLESGESLESFLSDFPTVEQAQAIEVLELSEELVISYEQTH